jgi:hypothetical protein
MDRAPYPGPSPDRIRVWSDRIIHASDPCGRRYRWFSVILSEPASMAVTEREKEWAVRVSRFLKAELKRLALAGLVLPQPPIAPVLDAVCRLDVAAEIAAVDFRPLAHAADRLRADLRGHRLAHLVRERAGIGYKELARRLNEHGLRETEDSISAKLGRGTKRRSKIPSSRSAPRKRRTEQP